MCRRVSLQSSLRIVLVLFIGVALLPAPCVSMLVSAMGQPGTVQLLQRGQFHQPSAEETAFYQAIYAFKAVHETYHLASQNGYDDEQMATAAYSLAKKKMDPVPANLTGLARASIFSSRFDDELKKHCPYPQYEKRGKK